jgi:hypothetical protein
MLMIMKYTLQQFNLVQVSIFTMDRGKLSLVVPILVNMIKAKFATIPTILESSKPPSKYSFHFFELNEMFKVTFLNVKRIKPRVLNPHL